MGTRWKSILRECLGNIHREWKITFTPIIQPEKWIFVVGCYNSGTTLLSEVLSRHNKISGLPTEGHFLTDQLISDYKIGLPRMWADREDLFRANENDIGPDVNRIKKEWGARLDRSKPIYLEKSPSNGARMRWLQANFENAYFIAVVRNGYAVAEGIRRKAEPMHLKDSWPIEQCVHQWKRSNEVLEEDTKHIKHYLQITYEDFTENTNTVLKQILEFIDLDENDGINLNEKWPIHERQQSIRNLNQESISRLSNEDIKKINQMASKEIAHFGYDLIQTNYIITAKDFNMNKLVKHVRRKYISLHQKYFLNFIFVHINKTAGSSIENALNIHFEHKTALQIIDNIGQNRWNKRFTFSFVRNPWDKAVSHFHYRIKTNQTDLKDKSIDFSDWVIRAYGEHDPEYYDKPLMFLPQVDWISDQNGKIIVDFIGKI